MCTYCQAEVQVSKSQSTLQLPAVQAAIAIYINSLHIPWLSLPCFNSRAGQQVKDSFCKEVWLSLDCINKRKCSEEGGHLKPLQTDKQTSQLSW